MSKKKTAQKAWSKIAFGILFVISCFIAMYILVRFYEKAVFVGGAAALLLISAFLFLNAIFSDKEKIIALQEEEEAFLNGTGGEFQLKIIKHMKEVEKNQKEMLEVLKDQSSRMESKLGDVQHEVYLFSEKQLSQTKSIIKYNKENARQLAISERETLEYVMHELKEAVENTASAETLSQYDADAVEEKKTTQENEINSVPEENMTEEQFAESVLDAENTAEEQFIEGVPDADDAAEEQFTESVPDAENTAEEQFTESVPDAENTAEEQPAERITDADDAAEKLLEESALSEEFEIPELPEDLDLSSLFDIPELSEEVPAGEENKEEISEVKDEAVAAEPVTDPNAMMTPEDIAKLLESMGK